MKGEYISAASFPIKLFHNPIIVKGKIVPYHITLIPTNVCNENCKECFCYKRDKTKSMDINEFKKIIDKFRKLGTRAISLSGGGEPDCHPYINEMIDYMLKNLMDVALVTNGNNLDKVNSEMLNKLTWIRVSGTSTRPINLSKLKKHINRAPYTDWGLSIVLSNNNYESLKDMIEFSNKNNITHIRVVSDMMYPNKNRLASAKKYIKEICDDSKVIWQERLENKLGSKKCKVPLLHPIIDVDGNIQPCCGIHFATESPTYDFGKKTSICNWRDYEKYIKKQEVYNGSKCEICQYDEYNKCLEMLLETPKHRRFI